MKKERNCGMNMAVPYPVYQPYPMTIGGNMMIPSSMGMNYATNSIDQQINNLEQQITLLDRRVTRLENSINDNKMSQYQTSNYNNSNYPMM